MSKGPCKGCQKRYVTCWAECDDYKRWKARLVQAGEQERTEIGINRTIADNKRKRCGEKVCKMQQKLRSGLR